MSTAQHAGVRTGHFTRDDTLEFCGRTRTIAQWSLDTGVSQRAIIDSLASGHGLGAILAVPGPQSRAPGDLTGKHFNLLTVLGPGVSTPKDRYWLCLCECGGLANVRVGHLLDGRTKSCGHLRADWGAKLRRLSADRHARLAAS